MATEITIVCTEDVRGAGTQYRAGASYVLASAEAITLLARYPGAFRRLARGGPARRDKQFHPEAVRHG